MRRNFFDNLARVAKTFPAQRRPDDPAHDGLQIFQQEMTSRNPENSPDFEAEMGNAEAVQFQPDGALDDAAAVFANTERLPVQSPAADLASLRNQFPFLPIIPWPRFVRTLTLTAQTAQDMILPDELKALMFAATSPTFVARDGRAEIPNFAAGANPSAQNDPGANTARSFLVPTTPLLFYVTGLRTLSFISQNAGTVQVMGWSGDRLPRPRASLDVRALGTKAGC